MFIEKYVDKKTGSLTVDGYREIYDAILTLADDADSYGLFQSCTPEDIQKCKWIAAIIEVLDDVPRRSMKHVFKKNRISFDYLEFINDEYH